MWWRTLNRCALLRSSAAAPAIPFPTAVIAFASGGDGLSICVLTPSGNVADASSPPGTASETTAVSIFVLQQ